MQDGGKRKEGERKENRKASRSRDPAAVQPGEALQDEVRKGWENRLNVGAKMWSSKKQVASGTGERRNFFRGPGLYDRLWRRAGQRLQGGWLVAGQGLYRKMEQKISWTGSPLRRASN